jgi:hypothetical protein
MSTTSHIAVRRKSLITVSDLRALLRDMIDKRPDISIRYRLIGEMWAVSFMRTISVRGNAVLFLNERTNKFISIHDITNIMQIELDQPFLGYQPHFHYEVQPVSDF